MREEVSMSGSNPVALVGASVNVGMNELVSVFIAKYEGDLFTKKDDISSKIKQLKSELSTLDKTVLGEVDSKQYNIKHIPILDINSRVEKVEIEWSHTSYHYKKPHCSVVVELCKGKTANRISHNEYFVDIPSKHLATHTKVKSEIESHTQELLGVMSDIKSVSRKERQVRGKISEMKLKESGFDNLLEHPDMLELIKV